MNRLGLIFKALIPSYLTPLLSLYILCPTHPTWPPNHNSCFPLSTVASCLHFCSGPQGLCFHSQLCNQCTRIDWLMLFSCSVVSDSSWPHGLRHARLPCSSLSPRVCSISHPLCRWRRPTISSSVAASLPALCLSQSFPMRWLFAPGGQSFGTSVSVLPKNIQGWFPLGLM